MATEYKLSYTGQEIDEKLGKIVDLDATLTQSGKTADAKAVGDAIENLSKEIDTIKNSMVDGGDDPAITAIAVTESADGTVTMVNTLEDGGTETLVISPDANGNPSKLTYNGTEIPIAWTDNGSSGASDQAACIVGAFDYSKNYQTLAMASPCDPIVGEYEVTT